MPLLVCRSYFSGLIFLLRTLSRVNRNTFMASFTVSNRRITSLRSTTEASFPLGAACLRACTRWHLIARPCHRSVSCSFVFPVLFFVVPPFGGPPKKRDITTRLIMPSTTRNKLPVNHRHAHQSPNIFRNHGFLLLTARLNPPCRFVNWT